MGLDIRLPIGLMFAILGVVLILSGLLMDKGIYHRSLGININLWWGCVLFVFGISMIWLGRKGSSALKTGEENVEGRKIGEYEGETGLEDNREA
ncbi:MAG: hypothetical protein ABL984_04035 [Pyrinomonadaceae bacterium]